MDIDAQQRERERERCLYGMCAALDARADITSPSAERDLFMN